MKVSVVLPVFRPGGLDITFAGLRDQSFKDFELILIDRRYEKRHKEVMAIAREYGVQTIHVPEHRRNGKWAVLSAAWNTGFMLAQGEVIIMVPDYAYVPPGWIEGHLKHHDGSPRMVLSPYVFRELPPVVTKVGEVLNLPGPEQAEALANAVLEAPPDTCNEISIFTEMFDPSWLPGLPEWPPGFQCQRRTMSPSEPMLYNHVHFRNESIPLETILMMNGFDEHLDRGKVWIDLEFGHRANLYGCQFSMDGSNIVTMLNPRVLFPSTPFGPAEGRWSYDTCVDYSRQRLSEGFRPAPNPYSLREKQETLRWWRKAKVIHTDLLNIPDEEYY